MYPHLLCDEHRDHYDDPSWGDQTTGGTRGDDVYCCPLGKFLSNNFSFVCLYRRQQMQILPKYSPYIILVQYFVCKFERYKVYLEKYFESRMAEISCRFAAGFPIIDNYSRLSNIIYDRPFP